MSSNIDNIKEETMSDSNIQNNVETVNTTTTTENRNIDKTDASNKSLEVSIDSEEPATDIDNNSNNTANTNTTTTPQESTASSTTATTTTTPSTSSSSSSSTDNTSSNNSGSSGNTNTSSSNDQQYPSTPLAEPLSSSTGSNQHGTHQAKFSSVKDIGMSSEKNPRFRRTMEDEHVIIDSFGGDPQQGYYAIYDGHGGRGAVDFTAKTLHLNLLEELNKDPNGDILEHIKNSYLTTDTQMGNEPIQFSGTTTISALIRYNEKGEKFLYIANAGDARAVISRNGVAERLSYDHKGSDQEEIKRITEAGGFVVNNRVNGILAVTRSLGDHSMKEYVVGDPYRRAIQLDPSYTHLILACDGLWDVVNDQDSIDLIINETEAQRMSDKLLSSALRKGSTDNISIMVIIL
ncbi:protein phosphatase 2C-related protein [Heterostelium album PN500]|uniref:Protein phosphatase 2C-related protein n=1 Tax=Heterostelium pallidum (strain ATCC 26659 / Pp 5 / PN500) TaxID=670386 RepID=D3B4Y1_HETP5|nr:protein phosphatase 2C-related protein [Heterostelium album PN500]EFA84379.1 protein phosphatase 2C-related protein [Heterostelium album PN500]|eukprot:XP_020436494.1 protein phosphatase 2C-related protein [Heterostelium album PN500]